MKSTKVIAGALIVALAGVIIYTRFVTSGALDKVLDELVHDRPGKTDRIHARIVAATNRVIADYTRTHGGIAPSRTEYEQIVGEWGPTDIWGNPLYYEPPQAPGGNWRIISFGANGQAGGSGVDEDRTWYGNAQVP